MTFPTYDEQKLGSLKDLEDVLALHMIEEKKTRQIWESIEKPVVLLKGIADINFMGGNAYLRKIVNVWEKGNRRFVLWNTKSFGVYSPENKEYNYLDKGFHLVGNMIIRSTKIPDDQVSHIRRMVKTEGIGSIFFHTESAVTLEELSKITGNSCSICMRLDGSYTMPPAKENIRCMKKLADEAEKSSRLRLTEESVVRSGSSIGIAGKKLADYVDFSQALCYNETNGPENSIMNAFVFAIARHRSAEIRMGSFSVNYERKGRRMFLDGTETSYNNLEHLVWEAPKMKTKEEFARLQKELGKTPADVKKFIDRGIILAANSEKRSSGYNPPEFLVKLGLECNDGKWSVISPLSGSKVVIDREKMVAIMNIRLEMFYYRKLPPPGMKDPVKVMSRLSRFFDEKLPLEMMKILEIFFGSAEAMKIMRIAKKNVEDAEKKGAKLLAETLEKHRKSVLKSSLRGKDGFIVKGKIRNYFITKDADVFTYPGYVHICIVEDDNSYAVRADKIVSRMLLLLNDDKLREDVSTLGMAEDGTVEEIELEEI